MSSSDFRLPNYILLAEDFSLSGCITRRSKNMKKNKHNIYKTGFIIIYTSWNSTLY